MLTSANILCWVERRDSFGRRTHCLQNEFGISLGWVTEVGPDRSIGRTQRSSVLLGVFRPPVEDMKQAVWDQVQQEYQP